MTFYRNHIAFFASEKLPCLLVSFSLFVIDWCVIHKKHHVNLKKKSATILSAILSLTSQLRCHDSLVRSNL